MFAVALPLRLVLLEFIRDSALSLPGSPPRSIDDVCPSYIENLFALPFFPALLLLFCPPARDLRIESVLELLLWLPAELSAVAS